MKDDNDTPALRDFRLKVLGNDVALPVPSEVPPEDVRQYLYVLGALGEYAKTAIKYWKTKADSGTEIPGMKLAQGRAKRDWTGEAEGALVQEYGEDAVYERVFRSPYKVETYLREERGLKPKEIANALQELIRVSHGTILVPDDDPRPAIHNKPERVFGVPDDMSDLI